MIDKLPHTFRMSDVPEELLTPRSFRLEWVPSKSRSHVMLDPSAHELESGLYYVGLKHKRWNKKRKHNKDKKYTDYERRPSRVEWYEWGNRYNAYARNVCFKHLRSKKVYLEEEYYDTDSAFWFDFGELEREDVFRCAGDCIAGNCISCDWQRQHDASTGWDDPNFIEGWDYTEEYWGMHVKDEEACLKNLCKIRVYKDLEEATKFANNIVVDKSKLKLV